MIPVPRFTIEMPELAALSPRKNNELIKAAMRPVLDFHWKRRIPYHFTPPAHAKYKYATRSPKYLSAKIRRYHVGADLVKTGRSRAEMTARARIRIGGTASGGTINGTIEMRFPFRGGTGAQRQVGNRQSITILQMIREVRAISDDEIREIERQIADNYMVLLETDTTKRMYRKV